MADHTITISNSMRVMQGGRPTLWGNTGATTMTWGTDKWGYDSEDGIQDVDKFFTDTLSLAGAYAELLLDHAFANTLTLGSEMTSELLTNGIWSYVFPDDVTEAEDRATNTWAAASSQSSTYSDASPPSTSWS